MRLNEAKKILNKAGYLLEDVEWLSETGTDASTTLDFKRTNLDGIGGMDLFHFGKPSKTYVILHYLYEDAPNGVITDKELCYKFFNGNNDNMKTWLSKNPDYILTALINNCRFYKISEKGIKAIQEAISSFESNDW